MRKILSLNAVLMFMYINIKTPIGTRVVYINLSFLSLSHIIISTRHKITTTTIPPLLLLCDALPEIMRATICLHTIHCYCCRTKNVCVCVNVCENCEKSRTCCWWLGDFPLSLSLLSYEKSYNNHSWFFAWLLFVYLCMCNVRSVCDCESNKFNRKN